MIINCARCNRPFESAMVNPEEAWKELLLHVTRHVEKKHPKTFRRVTQEELPRAIMALTEIYTVDQLIVVPESENWIPEHLDVAEDIVMTAVGYDPEEEEEEEDGEDLEDDDTADIPLILPDLPSDPAEPDEESKASAD